MAEDMGREPLKAMPNRRNKVRWDLKASHQILVYHGLLLQLPPLHFCEWCPIPPITQLRPHAHHRCRRFLTHLPYSLNYALTPISTVNPIKYSSIGPSFHFPRNLQK